MENNVEYTHSCCFNEGVDCGKHKCDNCGWNPDVYAVRIEKIKARRAEELREDM